MNFCISCAAGLEAILKKEIEISGYKVLSHAPTLVRFAGDLSAIAKINLRSRVWNKLYLELAQYQTADFDALFDLVQTVDWKVYIQDNPIVVNVITKWSALTSTPAIQRIVKKSITKKILNGKEWLVTEDEKLEPVEIFVYIQNNMCSLLLNTTGESLHKRGYKKHTGEAPINESLAAGLLLLSWRKFGEPLYDFFCGSGTIVIEAALLAKNIAPWIFRWFAFEHFARYDQTLFDRALQEAKSKMMLDKQHTIIASDINPEMIKIAKENARNAGVEKYISFATKDIKDYANGPELIGTMVSNPPYGLRMQMYDLIQIYRTIIGLFDRNPKLHGGIISSYEDFTPDNTSGTWKKTAFFNGGEKCSFYKKSLLQ